MVAEDKSIRSFIPKNHAPYPKNNGRWIFQNPRPVTLPHCLLLGHGSREAGLARVGKEVMSAGTPEFTDGGPPMPEQRRQPASTFSRLTHYFSQQLRRTRVLCAQSSETDHPNLTWPHRVGGTWVPEGHFVFASGIPAFSLFSETVLCMRHTSFWNFSHLPVCLQGMETCAVM